MESYQIIMKKLFKLYNTVFNLYREIAFFYYNHFKSEEKKNIFYRKYYHVKIGKNVRFLSGHQNFGSEPFLIEIGDNVIITDNVSFITHDGGVGIFRKEYPFMNVFGKIIIGNNVFIGSSTFILPGVKIGNNVVIGAGSIITRNIPDNFVAAGVPAKPVKKIEDYKRESLEKAVFIKELNRFKREKIILEHFK